MLSIKPIGSSRGEIGYYAALGQEDYYTAGGEPPGVWWGEAVSHFGLGAAVENDTFASLLQGCCPDSARPLVQNAGDPSRRSAFDLTFTVPKSVSIIWGLAGEPLRRQVEEATQRSVHHILDVVQEYCGVTRRGKQGQRAENAKLFAALFRHDTARGVDDLPPDPNLHVHCVLLNLVVREDGSAGALDARPLFWPHMKMALGALFRTQLAFELSRLGLECYRPERDRKPVSWFEIKGVPDQLIRMFSKRRGQIEAWLDASGLEGALASERAANATRSPKGTWKRDVLRAAWQREAEPLSFSPEKLVRSRMQHGLSFQPLRPIDSTAILSQITEHESHFTEIQLLRSAAEAAQTYGAGILEVRRHVESLLSNTHQIVELNSVRGQSRYTTPKTLEIEKELLELAEQSRGSWAGTLPGEAIRTAIRRQQQLGAQQKQAILHLVGGPDSVACVNGMAGTGKTHMLRVCNELWKQAEFHTLGTALAAKAAQNLEEGSGIPSSHLHVLLRDIDIGRVQLHSKSIIVVDEAGMIGTRAMHRLVRLSSKHDCKLVLVGDYRQLQAIEAGGPFKALCQRVGAAEMDSIIRQREPWTRQAVMEFAQGDVSQALGAFVQRGLLRMAPTRAAAMHELVKDWVYDFQTGGETQILSSLRSETVLLNRICQYMLQRHARLQPGWIEVAGERLHVGDRVVFTKNNARLLIKNGTGGWIQAFDRDKQTVKVQLDSGFCIHVDLRSYDSLALGYAVTVHKGQGQTVESAFVLVGGGMTDRQLTYVQASRARGTTRLYVDQPSAGPELATLLRQIDRSREKDLAIEHQIEVQ